MSNISGLQNAVVGVTTGPTWANTVNTNFTLIDSHDHSPGNGVQISLSSCTVNSNFSMSGFSLLNTNHIQLTDSTSSITSDKLSLYSSGGDLFYINSSGNSVQVTNGNSPAGGNGSIDGLAGSGGTASYSNPNFLFKKSATAPGNLLCGYVGLQNSASLTYRLSLNAPNLTQNLDQTFPLTPTVSGNSIMTMDNSGVMATQATLLSNQIQTSVDLSGVPKSSTYPIITHAYAGNYQTVVIYGNVLGPVVANPPAPGQTFTGDGWSAFNAAGFPGIWTVDVGLVFASEPSVSVQTISSSPLVHTHLTFIGGSFFQFKQVNASTGALLTSPFTFTAIGKRN